jgi:hypothetical protein
MAFSHCIAEATNFVSNNIVELTDDTKADFDRSLCLHWFLCSYQVTHSYITPDTNTKWNLENNTELGKESIGESVQNSYHSCFFLFQPNRTENKEIRGKKSKNDTYNKNTIKSILRHF